MSTPAAEVRSFQVTIPAGTPISAPFTQDIFFPVREVTSVHWKVPPGPSGLMGWRLTMSEGQAVIPTGGGWIIADNTDQTWPLTGQPDSGAWEVTGYNTDIYPHTIYLDFLLDLVSDTTAPPVLVANAAVSSPEPVTITTITTPPGVTVPPATIPAVTTPAAVTTPGPATVPAVTTPQLATAAAGQ